MSCGETAKILQGGRRESACTEQGREEEEREYLSPPLSLSLLRGATLLSCLADLKSAKPSICVETRARLVNKRPACAMGVHIIKSRKKEAATSCCNIRKTEKY